MQFKPSYGNWNLRSNSVSSTTLSPIFPHLETSLSTYFNFCYQLFQLLLHLKIPYLFSIFFCSTRILLLIRISSHLPVLSLNSYHPFGEQTWFLHQIVVKKKIGKINFFSRHCSKKVNKSKQIQGGKLFCFAGMNFGFPYNHRVKSVQSGTDEHLSVIQPRSGKYKIQMCIQNKTA